MEFGSNRVQPLPLLGRKRSIWKDLVLLQRSVKCSPEPCDGRDGPPELRKYTKVSMARFGYNSGPVIQYQAQDYCW
jgi:hypothetical protein